MAWGVLSLHSQATRPFSGTSPLFPYPEAEGRTQERATPLSGGPGSLERHTGAALEALPGESPEQEVPCTGSGYRALGAAARVAGCVAGAGPYICSSSAHLHPH